MATSKITDKIARTIRAAHKKGRSSAQISALVEERHKVAIDRSAITRHLQSNPPKPKTRASAPAETPTTPAASVELDEIALLTERAQELLARARSGVSVMGEAALSREWRQTMRQRAKAMAEAQTAKDQDTAALDWVVDKLERYAAANTTPPPKDETDGVPASSRAAGG